MPTCHDLDQKCGLFPGTLGDRAGSAVYHPPRCSINDWTSRMQWKKPFYVSPSPQDAEIRTSQPTISANRVLYGLAVIFSSVAILRVDLSMNLPAFRTQFLDLDHSADSPDCFLFDPRLHVWGLFHPTHEVLSGQIYATVCFTAATTYLYQSQEPDTFQDYFLLAGIIISIGIGLSTGMDVPGMVMGTLHWGVLGGILVSGFVHTVGRCCSFPRWSNNLEESVADRRY